MVRRHWRLFCVMTLLFVVTAVACSIGGQMSVSAQTYELEGGWQPGPEAYHPGRVLVRFSDSIFAEEATDSIGTMGYSVSNVASFVPTAYFANGVRIGIVEIPEGESVDRAIAELDALPGIEYAQRDYVYYPDYAPDHILANDKYFDRMWGLNNEMLPPEYWDPYMQGEPVYDADIDAAEAWMTFTGSSELIVAVIDSGTYIYHPDLFANIWVNEGEIPGNGIDDDGNGYIDDVYGWDFFNNDNTVFDPEERDRHGRLADQHGTHVSGTIGAVSNNNIGVTGINWNVRVMPLKFIGGDGGYASDAILALQYAAANGAVVANMSWGGGSYDQALKDAIEASGMLCIAAAGNEGIDTDIYPHYPSSYDSPNLISVAASMMNDEPCDYRHIGGWSTNYGRSTVDLFAPGGFILSTIAPDPPPAPGEAPGEAYSFYYGTSMATPHVTGVAALLAGKYPRLPLYPGASGSVEGSPNVRDIILNSVDKKTSFRNGCVTGGRLNANNALNWEMGPIITSAVAEPEYGPPPLEVEFAASAIDPASEIASVWWDFGDGSQIVEDYNATHTYAEQGEYTASFHAVNTVGIESVATVEIRVYLPPTIGVSPTSLASTLKWGETATEQITIANTGLGDLHYNIDVEVDLLAPDGTPMGATGGSIQPLGAGGPDHHGLFWIDSDHPNGPLFDWRDISKIGTAIRLRDDRDQRVDLPFAFPYYGETKTRVRIGSNGYLTFGNYGKVPMYHELPAPADPNDVIAVFWTDLNPEQGGQVYYYGDENVFIVQYDRVARHDSPERYTFQVILTSDGNITFNYLEMGNSRLDEASIGIENSTGTDGLGVAYRQNYVHDNLTVKFIPVWINVDPVEGVVSPGEAQDVSVTFEAGELPQADWRAKIIINSDDPANAAVSVDTVLAVESLIAPRITSIEAQPWAGEPPLEVHFSAEAVDVDGEIVDIVWNFGDGSDPLSGMLTTTHTYEIQGNYIATLTVTDDDMLSSEATVNIMASPIPDIGVEPSRFMEVVRAHRTRTDKLTVVNNGGADLSFTATTATTQPPTFKWLSVNPASGTVPAGGSMDIEVRVDLTPIAEGMLDGVVTIESNDVYKPSVTVPVQVEVIPNQPPTITACGVNPGRGPVATVFQFSGAAYDEDGSIADMYWEFGDGTPAVHQAIATHTYGSEGTYTAKFHATDNDGYKTTQTVTVYVQQPPSAGWNPSQIAFRTAKGQSVSETLTLNNGGPGALVFGVDEVMGSSPMLERVDGIGYMPDPYALTAEGMFCENVYAARSQFLPDAVGAVIKSWISPLPIAVTWGLGANHNSGELVIGDPSMKENFVVTTEGRVTGKSYRTNWAGAWAADMAFDGEYIWQVNVGGDNGIYKLNPDTGEVVGFIRDGAWTHTAQRGLAYDVNDDTFYVGGWVDHQIYKIKGESWDNPGEVLDQWEMVVGIAGLAYHPTANILVVTANSRPDMIYFVDPITHNTIAQLPHPGGRENWGAGCEFDPTGNLWVASMGNNMVYLIDTGLGPIVDWLTWRPASGVVPAGGSVAITVTADTSRLGPGTHDGRVTIFTNDVEYPLITVPVILEVAHAPKITEATATPAIGEPPLEVEFHAAVEAPDTPLVSYGWNFGDGTSAAGFDATHMYAAAGVYKAVFTVTDQLGGTARAELVINVRPLPRATLDPTEIEFTLSPVSTATRTLTLGNVQGNADLNFEVKPRRGNVPTVALPKRTGMPAEPYAKTAIGLYEPLDPEVVRAFDEALQLDAVGGGILSWPVPSVVEYAWGLGFDESNLWIGDPFSNTAHVVTPEGVHTLTRFGTPWSADWAADLAYDENHNLMWQVNVGGDNGIYGMNLTTGEVEAVIADGAWTGVDQRGLAYNNANDTFYIGGWNQDIIYHIKGLSWDNPGEILEQWSFPVAIAGLAWHPNGVLWVANNGAPDMIYALDAETHALICQFQHPGRLDYSGAGLALHEDGNLWVTSQKEKRIYLVDTGMPAVPGVNVSPARGVVPMGGTTELEIAFDGSKMGAPGEDVRVHVEVATDDPASPSLYANVVVHLEDGPSIDEVTASPTIGDPPLTVTFDATVSPGAKPIADIWWDFGDGSDPVHNAHAEHVYDELGVYNACVHVVDEVGLEVTAEVAITVQWLPKLEVEPGSFDKIIDAGSVDQDNLRVSNPGTGPMNFQISTAPSFAQSPEWKQYAASEKVKGDFEAEPRGFAGAGAGGPDQFGYVWMDSNQANGPKFDWSDISELGTRVPLFDESGVTVRLPFEFPFYGEFHRFIGIASNGYLSFDQGALKRFPENSPIPNADDPNYLIAAFWDDLDPSAGGGVYYYYDESRDCFIVQYNNVPQWGSDSVYTFQIVLEPDGTITYQYLSMIGDVTSATVGIENGTGEDGLQVVYNAPYIEDRLAVAFSPVGSVLEVNPKSGLLIGGASQDVVVTFGSARATPGTYSLYLYVIADDPFRPFAAIPVRLKLNLPPEASVSAPAAGVEWHGESEIIWTGSDPDDEADSLSVDLYWTRDGENWNEIATGVENTGSYLWNTSNVGAGGDTFQVRVVVHDPAGARAEYVTDMFTIVNLAPVASFSFEPAEPTIESVIKFADESADDGTILAWHWEFGDGAESDEHNPEHKYDSKGSYMAKLTVTDNGGLTGTTELPVEVVNSAPVVKLMVPEADSVWTANQTMNIEYGASDVDGDELAITLEYDCIGDDFGWGTIAVDQPNTGTYAWNLSRVKESGRYVVRVIATDVDGASVEATSGEFTVTLNTAPIAAFSVSPSPATKRDVVKFTDESTDDGQIVAWHWEFGDGAESDQQHPEHQYAAKGVFTVRLTVTDDGGLSATGEQMVEIVNAAPEAKVITPVAGSMFTSGKPIMIEYEATDADEDELKITFEYNFLGDSLGWKVIAKDQANTGQYAWDASKLEKGGAYQIRVTACDPDGDIGQGTSDEFIVVMLSKTIIAAPNPASDQVVFYYNIATDGTLYVYDISGRLMHSTELSSSDTACQWNLMSSGRPVANGIYLYVVVSDGAKSEVGRLVIDR